ncbi:MAG: hypothetical protein CL678_01250 [Bdellovibrionaceae bacterium]|nr:hypothetical protein [Pseudobdellovibrionaceae bacterium]|tara:strand:+ start:1188 stop:2024 length:837 start_codon:yes stop_codon:yes gene_type:complete
MLHKLKMQTLEAMGDTNYAYRARVAHDAIGATVHPIAAGLLLAMEKVAKTTTIKLLVAQELVAFVFHVFYCLWHAQPTLMYRAFGPAEGTRNSGKWAEYALSATLGTIAVLYASEQTIDWWWILLLCATCVSQQLIGYTLDQEEQKPQIKWANFCIAWILQICEFLIVLSLPERSGSSTEETYSLRIVYVLAWSSFGMLAFIDIKREDNQRFLPDWNDTIEAMYACLSWTSKLAVVLLSVYPFAYVAVLALLGGIVCIAATWIFIIQNTSYTQVNAVL